MGLIDGQLWLMEFQDSENSLLFSFSIKLLLFSVELRRIKFHVCIIAYTYDVQCLRLSFI